MPIYTKTGDDGTTSLFGGKRLLKSDLRVETYGTVDELTSFIGLVAGKNKKEKKVLTGIQEDLYQIMGYLSGNQISLDFIEAKILFFEKRIDVLSKKLPPIKNFIFPQGTEISSWFHILRTICRRAERSVVRYCKKNKAESSELKIIRYFNRLSDLFFILARYYNNQENVIIIK